jgi:hypothetical protein
VYCVRDTEHVHACSSRNYNIPLMRRANTDIATSKPVTLHSNQLLIRYGVSRLYTHVTVLGYAVLQVCTHPNSMDARCRVTDAATMGIAALVRLCGGARPTAVCAGSGN